MKIVKNDGTTFTPVPLPDDHEFVQQVKAGIDFIGQFEDPIIGLICLENDISIERAKVAGAKIKGDGDVCIPATMGICEGDGDMRECVCVCSIVCKCEQWGTGGCECVCVM